MKLTRNKLISFLAGLLLLLGMIAAYSNHFHNGFHFDDGHTIVNNGAIRDLGNIPRFFRDATTFSTLPSNQSYRPLISTLLAIDYWLGGALDPFAFHISVFVIFLALTLLVGFVTLCLLPEAGVTSSASFWVAIAGAAVFGLHPANADPVNYIIVSAEIMAALGVMASFAFYFAFPNLRRSFLYVLPAALTILAKPTAAIFPVLLVAFLFSFPAQRDRNRARTNLRELIPPFLLCGAMLWLVEAMTPPSWIAGARNPGGYLLTQPFVVWLYFKTFFWPTGLSADYDLAPLAANDARVWIGFVFTILLAGLAVAAARRKKTRLISFGLLWFLIGLLPTALFPLAEVMNNYRPLLSYVGLIIACTGVAVLFLPRLEEQRSATKWTFACVLLLALSASAYATFQRNRVWENEETLWHDVVEKSPRNGRGLLGYGIQLMNKGDFAGALDYFQRAQKFTPEYYVLLINLAVAENATGQEELAEAHFQEALRRGPWDPQSYTYYARYLLVHSRVTEARAFLEQALKLSPGDLMARQLLQASEKRDISDEAVEGDTLLRQGRIAEAFARYEAVLRTNPDAAPTLNNFAWALSTAPVPSLRNGARALDLAQRACDLAGGKNPVFIRTMAAAYAENGRFEEAIATAERARQLALAQQNSILTQNLSKDLSFYERHHALHP